MRPRHILLIVILALCCLSPIAARAEITFAWDYPPAMTITAGDNDTLFFSYDAGPYTGVTIAAGSYATHSTLAAALQTAINTAFSIASTVTWSDNKITIDVGAGHTIAHLVYPTSSAGSSVGFPSDKSAAQAITADTAILTTTIAAGTADNATLIFSYNGSDYRGVKIAAGIYPSCSSLASALQTAINAHFGASSTVTCASGIMTIDVGAGNTIAYAYTSIASDAGYDVRVLGTTDIAAAQSITGPAVMQAAIATGQTVLRFSYDHGPYTNVSIAAGTYTDISVLAAALKTAVDTAFSISSTVTYAANKLKIDVGAGHTIGFISPGSTAGTATGFTESTSTTHAQTVTASDAVVRVYITSNYTTLCLSYDAGPYREVNIASATYTTGSSLAAAIKTAVDTAFSISSTVTWSDNKITIDVGAGHTIAYKASISSTAASITGFTADRTTAARSIASATAIETVVIGSSTYRLILTYDGGAATNVDIAQATYYDIASLATAIKTAVDTAFSISSTVTYANNRIKIDVGAGHTIAYTLTSSTAGTLTGFTANKSAAQAITADAAILQVFVGQPTNGLILSYDSGADTAVPIAAATYTTGASFASAIQTAVDAAFSISSTVTWSSNKITIDVGAGHTIAYSILGSAGSGQTGFNASIPAAQAITAGSAIMTLTLGTSTRMFFSYDAGAYREVNIAAATYADGTSLAAAIKTAVDAAFSISSTVTWSDNKITIDVGAGHTIAYSVSEWRKSAYVETYCYADIAAARSISCAPITPADPDTIWFFLYQRAAGAAYDYTSPVAVMRGMTTDRIRIKTPATGTYYWVLRTFGKADFYWDFSGNSNEVSATITSADSYTPGTVGFGNAPVGVADSPGASTVRLGN